MNQQTTCVGGYQPDVCGDNIVAALKVHTEMMNRFPLSALGTSNSYSEHELCTNGNGPVLGGSRCNKRCARLCYGTLCSTVGKTQLTKSWLSLIAIHDEMVTIDAHPRQCA